MDFNYQTFINNINKDLDDAFKLVSDKEDIIYKESYGNNVKTNTLNDYVLNEEKDFNEQLLESVLTQIKIKLQFGFSILNIQDFLKQFLNDWNTIDKNKITDLTMLPYVGVLASPTLMLLHKYVKVFETQVTTNEKNEIKQDKIFLERILRGTATIIKDNSLIPENESDIRKKLFEILKHVFPDTTRELPFPKIVKTYKADFGIKSLKSAIEYKFVANENDAKTFIGGIFEDVHGYSDFEDWKYFYAVIYLNDYYLTEDQIKEEFRRSNIPDNWIPIIVYGIGQRKLKKKTKK